MTDHAHEPRRCTARDFMTAKGDDEAAVADFLRQADAYLAIFVAPVRDGDKLVCFHCGCELDSFKQMMGIGAAIEWGLVHGEGRCSGMPHHDKPCGWPYRGHHFAKGEDGGDLFTLHNMFLAYHPDEVTVERKDEAA